MEEKLRSLTQRGTRYPFKDSHVRNVITSLRLKAHKEAASNARVIPMDMRRLPGMRQLRVELKARWHDGEPEG